MKIVLLASLYFLPVSSNVVLIDGIKQSFVETKINSAIGEDGWQILFDGKTTKGWHTYGKTTANNRWNVADGALYLDTDKQEGGDIVTDEAFENFDLKLEWKISKNGNSGIIININEDVEKYKETYKTGPEIQVLDNDGHSDGKISKHRAGDLYDLVKSSSEPVKAVGEWNAVEIISNKGKLQIFMNGINVVTTNLWDDNWRKLIAGSKFNVMPDFGTFKKGRIALQDHGNAVWYRNISIKKL